MIPPVFIGCDVPSAHLDISFLQGDSVRQARFSNSASGHRALTGVLAGAPPERIVLEATGRL